MSMSSPPSSSKESPGGGCSAKIVKIQTSPIEILLLFYNNRKSNEEKVRIAVEKGYVIPPDYVPCIRRMHDNGTLGGQKMYSISGIYLDPDMQPLKGHPQFEHNPKYKREYPRRIQPEESLIRASEEREHVDEEPIYERVLSEKYTKYLKRKIRMRVEMKIPKFKLASENRILNALQAEKCKQRVRIRQIHENNAHVTFLPNIDIDCKKLIVPDSLEFSDNVCTEESHVNEVDVEFSGPADESDEENEEYADMYSTSIQKNKWEKKVEKKKKEETAPVFGPPNDWKIECRSSFGSCFLKQRDMFNKRNDDRIKEHEAAEAMRNKDYWPKGTYNPNKNYIVAFHRFRTRHDRKNANKEAESATVQIQPEEQSPEQENLPEASGSSQPNQNESSDEVPPLRDVVFSVSGDLRQDEPENDEYESDDSERPLQIASDAEIEDVDDIEMVEGDVEEEEEHEEEDEIEEQEEDDEVEEEEEDVQEDKRGWMASEAEVLVFDGQDFPSGGVETASVEAQDDEEEREDIILDDDVANEADFLMREDQEGDVVDDGIVDMPTEAEDIEVGEHITIGNEEVHTAEYLFREILEDHPDESVHVPSSSKGTDAPSPSNSMKTLKTLMAPLKKLVIEEEEKEENPWEEIVQNADIEFEKRSSAPQSLRSASSMHDNADDLSKELRSAPGSRRQSAMSTPVPSILSPKPEASVSRKPRGRPRKSNLNLTLAKEGEKKESVAAVSDNVAVPPIPTPVPIEVAPVVDVPPEEVEPEIVVEKTEPSEFLAPDADLLVTDQFVKRRRGRPRKLVAEHSFARPDIEPFVAETRADATVVVVEDEPMDVEIGEPKRKFSKLLKDADEVASKSSGSLLPPESTLIERRRRKFISKHNPAPRHRRITDLEGSSNASNTGLDSDDAMSRGSSSFLAPTSSKPGVVGASSRNSSVLGDFDSDLIRLEGFETSRNSFSFGDPKPPPTVTIDEETDVKTEVDDTVLPPINETSRKSLVKARKEKMAKEQVVVVIDDDVVIDYIQPKQEAEDEDCVMVNAAYKVPRSHPVAVEEKDTPPAKARRVDVEEVTHTYVVNKYVNDSMNEIFSSDPTVFSNLVMCLIRDKKEEGKTYLESVEVCNRTSPYTAEFIDMLSKSPRDGGMAEASLRTYGKYTGEFRCKCALPDIIRDGLTPKNFYEVIEMGMDLKRRIFSSVPVRAFSSPESEVLSKVENIIAGRFVVSSLKMASLSNAIWVTHDHIRRRFEHLLYGWKEFLRRGGFFLVLLNLSKNDLKLVSKEFMALMKRMLDECEANVAKAATILTMSDEDVIRRIAVDCSVTDEQLKQVTDDFSLVETKTHKEKCLRCKTEMAFDVYFSSDVTMDIHNKLVHECECHLCYEDVPNKTSIDLHVISTHFSIHKDYKYNK